MAAAPPSPSRRRWRAVLRGVRLAVLLIALLGLLGVLYLHHVGLPGWACEPVAAALRRHGVELSFRRLYLSWYQGLVAEEVTLALPHSPGSPQGAFAQVVLNPDWRALWSVQALELRELSLRNGRLKLPLAETNAPPEDLLVDVITARLDLTGSTVWRVEEFSARCLGITLQAQGTLTNGPAFWRASAPAGTGTRVPAARNWRGHLRTLQRTLARLHFPAPPELLLRFHGDAHQAESWNVELQARAAEVDDSRWGRGRELQLYARWMPPTGDNAPSLDLEAALAEWTGSWGRGQDVQIHLDGRFPGSGQPELSLRWELRAAEIDTGEVRAEQPRLKGQTLWFPATQSGRSTVDLAMASIRLLGAEARSLGARARIEHVPRCEGPEHIPGRGWLGPLTAHVDVGTLAREAYQSAELSLDLALQPAAHLPAAEAIAALPPAMRPLAPFELRLGLQATALTSPMLAAEHLSLGAQWIFPAWTLTNLQARLLEGTLRLSHGRLELLSREAAAELAWDFDIQKLDRLLPERTRQWLGQFQYTQPPQATVAARVRLPPWDAWGPDLGRQLRSTLALRARLDGRNVQYRQLQSTTAGVTITVSNEVLRLRDLELVRPEGRAVLAYDLDLRTRDFRWRVDCAVDAHAAAPAVDDSLPPILALFEFSRPPHVTGEVWGNWNPPRTVDFALHVAATNFTFRGEAFDTLVARLGKTNEYLTFSDVHLTHGTEWIKVPWALYDLARRVVTLTNAQTQLDPGVVARCLGPEVVATLEPYHFAQPPRVTVNGTVPLAADRPAAALDFEVAGGPFRFWRFSSTNVTAGVRWRGESVSVTNLAAAFYGGRISGGVDLNLQPGGGAGYRFQALATEFDLQALLRDVLPESTKRIEGLTTLSLIVTDAQTTDWQSWHGRGHVEMRDGLLWDLPIFGFLSQALNVVAPGLGNSRATAARASFRIQRSVVYTEDLAIETALARLQYRGKVDFAGRVDARVVAEVLHRTPIIGPLLSLALTPVAIVFEYRVTGTLSQPQLKPLYVPGFLRPLLNPLGTLQNLVAPPATPPPPPKPTPP